MPERKAAFVQHLCPAVQDQDNTLICDRAAIDDAAEQELITLAQAKTSDEISNIDDENNVTRETLDGSLFR